MKRYALAGLLVIVMLGGMLVAGADHSGTHQVLSGTIDFSNPVTTTVGLGGITETEDACTPGGANDGVDGKWFALADGSVGKSAKLSFPNTLGTPASAGTDFDVYFYTASCGAIAYSTMASISNPEVGVVPPNSAFVIVNYYAGPPNTSFTLEIDAA